MEQRRFIWAVLALQERYRLPDEMHSSTVEQMLRLQGKEDLHLNHEELLPCTRLVKLKVMKQCDHI